MFEYIKGAVTLRQPTRVVLETGGVGYDVTVPLSTFSALGECADAKLLIHYHVREDLVRLFGFATEAERTLFRRLIAVSGIGPQVALTILSNTPIEDFIMAVAEDDVDMLKSVKGIGPKTAARLVLEMKQSIGDLASLVPDSVVSSEPVCVEEARLALVSLGYSRAQADKAVKKALDEFDESPRTEELLRKSFRHT